MKNLTTALLIILALSACKRHQDPKHELPVPVTTYVPNSYDSLAMYYVNFERAKAGIPGPALEVNPKLGDVCATHSVYMVMKEKASHDFFTARAELFPGNYVGEVVAYNYQTPRSVVTAWMNSKGHHDIILNPDFTEFACSHHISPSGKIYVEMMLIGPRNTNKPATAGIATY